MAISITISPDVVSANVEGVQLVCRTDIGSNSGAIALLCTAMISRQCDAITQSTDALGASLRQHPAKLDRLVLQLEEQNKLRASELRAALFSSLQQLSGTLVHEEDLHAKFEQFRASLIEEIDKRLSDAKGGV